MNDQKMTIREMCEAFNVTPRTLRFYESRELLFPQRVGQRRIYDRRDRGRLTLILQGKRFGFSLEEIRQLLELYEPGGHNREQISATLRTARERLADMTAQRDELCRAIDDLASRIAATEERLSRTPP